MNDGLNKKLLDYKTKNAYQKVVGRNWANQIKRVHYKVNNKLNF